MSLFADFSIVAAMLVASIVFCFFLPELLYRLGGKARRSHSVLAALLLITAVLALSGLHGAANKAMIPEVEVTVESRTGQTEQQASEQQAAAKAEEQEPPELDFSVNTRFGTLPMNLDSEAPLELSIANNGAAADFTCELAVLNGSGAAPAPMDAYLASAKNETVSLAPGDTGACSWSFTPLLPGSYVLQAAAAADGQSVSQQVSIKAELEQTVNVDDEVWVFHSRTKGNDAVMAKKLKRAGFHNSLAKGEWKTSSEEQFVFYRDKDKKNLNELFVEIGLPNVQPYFFDSDRVGSKVKEFFRDNPKMGFLVIIH